MSSLPSVFLAPLTACILIPKHKNNNSIKSIFYANYSLSIIFIVGISFLLGVSTVILHNYIQSIINIAYIQKVYNDSYSFIYGLIYQFTKTFGFGDFILDIRRIDEKSTITQTFYATSIIINFFAIPGIILALITKQKPKRRLFHFLLLITSILSANNTYALSLILIYILWMYPAIYGIFLILSLVFYTLSYYLDLNMLLSYNCFEKYSHVLGHILDGNKLFWLYSSLVFLANYFFTLLTIEKKKKYIQHNKQNLRILKPIIIDISDNNNESQDYSSFVFFLIKQIGGFNNIQHLELKDDKLYFTILNKKQIHTNDFKEISAIISYQYSTEDEFIFIIQLKKHADIIYSQIIYFAQRLLIDLETRYKKITKYELPFDKL
ncbi:MAG: hypothetical protein ACI4V7_00755 [Succinivibrionaceae bacterium]